VWKYARIEPRAVATFAMAARRSNHQSRSHPRTFGYRSHRQLDDISSTIRLIQELIFQSSPATMAVPMTAAAVNQNDSNKGTGEYHDSL